MSVFIMGAAIGAGAGPGGTQAGPGSFRAAGLLEQLVSAGYRVRDGGDLPRPEPLRASHLDARRKLISETAAWADLVRQVVRQLPDDRIPVLLGGDRSLSLGSLPGLAERAALLERPLFVLWIDAVAGCQTPVTTEGDHLPAMPVAYALGETGFAPGLPVPEFPVAGANIMLLGICQTSGAENAVIARHGLAVPGQAELRRQGVAAILAPFLDRVVEENGMLHLSLAARALDGSTASGMAAPAAALSPGELRETMHLVASSGTLASLELVDVDPGTDRDRGVAPAMVELAVTAIGLRPADAVRKVARR